MMYSNDEFFDPVWSIDSSKPDIVVYYHQKWCKYVIEEYCKKHDLSLDKSSNSFQYWTVNGRFVFSKLGIALDTKKESMTKIFEIKEKDKNALELLIRQSITPVAILKSNNVLDLLEIVNNIISLSISIEHKNIPSINSNLKKIKTILDEVSSLDEKGQNTVK